jgi:hypothetical protein
MKGAGKTCCHVMFKDEAVRDDALEIALNMLSIPSMQEWIWAL